MDNTMAPAEAATGRYFKDVPFAYVLVFGWFFYGLVSSLVEVFKYLMVLVNWFTMSPRMLLFLIPVVSVVLSGAIVWGLFTQAKWTKIVVAAWYVAVLVYLGFSVYPLLSSIGYNSMNQFYYQGGVSMVVWLSLIPTALVFAINSCAAYYLLKKVSFGNN